MMIEDKLVTKTYFELFIGDTDSHPIKLLGDLFLREHRKEIPDASHIRYSQGEVYYHHHDYEAAIYKWENVHNELRPWALKNCGDAYMDLELYESAEKVYQSIHTNSQVLQSEILLQLFYLYKKVNNMEKARVVIKELIQLNPNPEVYKLALQFFENQEEFQNAIQIAMEAGNRLRELDWFIILKNYIDSNHTKNIAPSLFYHALKTIETLDYSFLEDFVESIVNSYSEHGRLIHAISEINQFFLQMNKKSYKWEKLPKVYESVYKHLMSGNYTLKELDGMLQEFFAVWIELVDERNAMYAASSIFSWNEKFQSKLERGVLKKAEQMIFHSNPSIDVWKETESLHKQLFEWALKNRLQVDAKSQFLLDKLLCLEEKNIGVVSLAGVEQSIFINSLLNEPVLLDEESKVPSFFQDYESLVINEYYDEGTTYLDSIDSYSQLVCEKRRNLDSLISVKLPNRSLREGSFNLIDIPQMNSISMKKEQIEIIYRFVDEFIFIFTEATNMRNQEVELIKHLIENYSESPITFIVFNCLDDRKRNRLIKDIQFYLPRVKITDYRTSNKSRKQLISLLKNTNHIDVLKKNREKKYLMVLKMVVENFFKQRERAEGHIADDIRHKVDVLSRLNGAFHQLADIEKEKAEKILSSYSMLKDLMKKEMENEISILLKRCEEKVTEERDFRTLHEELNDEMNEEIDKYLNETLLPSYLKRLNEWMETSKEELKLGEQFLQDLATSFNSMLNTDEFHFPCNFQILEDWKRDIDRLTSKPVVQKKEILKKHSPSAIMLKNTGKIISAISPNKAFLVKSYKNLIKNESYKEVVASISKHILEPFYIIEQGIERDVAVFFKGAVDLLQQYIEKLKKEIEQDKENMEKLRSNPEYFKEPLLLFDILISQYQYIADAQNYVKVLS